VNICGINNTKWSAKTQWFRYKPNYPIMKHCNSLLATHIESPFVPLLCILLWESSLSLHAQSVQTLLTTPYEFDGTYGANINGLVAGNDGSFYGSAFAGGIGLPYDGSPYDDPYAIGGTVFKIAENGTPIWFVAFDGTNGANPTDLVQGINGNFYGTTYLGGTNNAGTVFQVNSNGLLTSLYSFDWTNGCEASLLLQGKDGSFYGITAAGGPDYLGGPVSNEPANAGFGTVFNITTNGNFTPLYFFRDGDDGANPVALFQDSDGCLYGSTSGGGASNAGTIFRFTTNGGINTLYTFTGGGDGANPGGSLFRGADGNLYGITESSGTNSGYGNVFCFRTNGVLTNLATFAGTNGAAPSSLIQANDGSFYGTTQFGGTFTNQYGSAPPYYASIQSSYGTIFKLTSNGVLTVLVSFNLTNGVSPDGLAQGADGSFYGVAQFGGTNGQFYVLGGGTSKFASGGDGALFRMHFVPNVPTFQTVQQSQGQIIFGWTATIGESYLVQYTCDLGSTNWMALEPAFIASNTIETASDLIGSNSVRFYRVVQSP
jgi:uncharacterized repeat protein (TIGR03803 family)